MDICILNSGFGSRLRKYTEHMPKALVPLHGSATILSRQISTLDLFGNHRYAITTGYMDGAIQNYLNDYYPSLDAHYFFNSTFASTNYIASMQLLENDFTDEIVLLHGDLVFEPSVAHDILIAKQDVVVIDSTLPLPEKDFKARVVDGKIADIGINVFGNDCYACQPFYHLHKSTWNAWQAAIGEFCQKGNDTVYAEEALNTILETQDLHPLDVRGRFCMEIDNEEDLARAIIRLGNQNE